MILTDLRIAQQQRTATSCIFCAFAALMYCQPPLWVGGGACIESAVAAAEYIDPVSHVDLCTVAIVHNLLVVFFHYIIECQRLFDKGQKP